MTGEMKIYVNTTALDRKKIVFAITTLLEVRDTIGKVISSCDSIDKINDAAEVLNDIMNNDPVY